MRTRATDRWGTHVIEPPSTRDAAYLVYARPGFATYPGHRVPGLEKWPAPRGTGHWG